MNSRRSPSRSTRRTSGTARRFIRDDQDGLRDVGLAILALADDPYPAEAFHRGSYHRLRAGRYRVLYFVDDDVVTIERVDRLS